MNRQTLAIVIEDPDDAVAWHRIAARAAKAQGHPRDQAAAPHEEASARTALNALASDGGRLLRVVQPGEDQLQNPRRGGAAAADGLEQFVLAGHGVAFEGRAQGDDPPSPLPARSNTWSMEARPMHG